MSLTVLRTAFSGMQAATRRLEAVASNVAAAGISGPLPGPDGASSAYRPLSVRQVDLGGGVEADLVPRAPAYTRTYDPTDPAANADGLVAAPAVDLGREMVDLLFARMGYKANLKVAELASRLSRDAIDRLA